MRKKGCFVMYIFVYRKYDPDGDRLGIMASSCDNWKDALSEFMITAGENNDEDTQNLYSKCMGTLTLKESIRLMYLLNGIDVTILDMYEGASRVNFGQEGKNILLS